MMAGDTDRPAGDAPPHIFVSYSRTDQTEAIKVINALEEEGFNVWWDGLLEAGTQFIKTTEAALEKAAAVVVLWSENSIESNWVRDEATIGRDKARLVPISLDGSMPPLGFRQFQCIDISGWKGNPDAPAMRNVIETIGQHVRPDPTQPHLLVIEPKSGGVSRRSLIVGGGVAALALGGVAAWQGGLLGGGASGTASLAILPFQNLGGDPEQDYFSTGLSEELRAALGQQEDLQIAGQTSSNILRESGDDPRAMAKRLGVGYLLDGSVRRAGDALRISVQLIDGSTGFDTWSETFDRTMADVFAVQTEIAQRVAGALAVAIPELGGPNTNRLGSTTNPEALDAYLEGTALYELAADEGTDRAALARFDFAISQDPNYAAAWAAKSRTQTAIANAYATGDEVDALYDQAIAAARKAIAIEPRLAAAHSALGFVLFNGRLDAKGAAEPFEMSRQFGGGNPGILQSYATYEARMGNFDAAREAIRKASKLDPLNAYTWRTAAMVEYFAGDFPAARELIDKTLEINPEMRTATRWLADMTFLDGDYAEALKLYEEDRDGFNKYRGLATTHHALGNLDAARAARARMRAEYGDNALYQDAQIATQWGETEEALTLLERAYDVGDSGMVLAKTDPLLVPLRKEARFRSLLGRMGFD